MCPSQILTRFGELLRTVCGDLSRLQEQRQEFPQTRCCFLSSFGIREIAPQPARLYILFDEKRSSVHFLIHRRDSRFCDPLQ